ncbi:putative deoxyribonuclease TATDN2 [Amphiura filiformis]|uniref:putative deoxyribonuclease TATDN2 n=1 Tax=Amphiura filiformis TaxID=82378 RepID=UPI003B20F8E0
MYPYSMRDYIDTHCHIDFLYQRISYKGTFQKFTTQHHFPPNYAGCVAIFCTPESLKPHGIWKDLMNEDKIWGAFGIHPHHAKYYDGWVEEHILSCMKHPKAVALGEIGLDYSNRNSSDWILQQEVFRRQLNMALKMDKPLVIHSRDAEDDTINIMASMVPRDYPIHRHCFTGTPEEAQRWFSVFPKSFIGLTALVTFPSAFPTHRTAKEIPLERLLLETDSPYFLPRQCPRTLKFANPSMAVFVAERIARLKGITTDEVLIAVRKNTKLMYGV